MRRPDTFLTAAALALIAVVSTGALAEQPTVATFGLGNKLVRHSNADLTSHQRAAYRAFGKDMGYFGAFAIHSHGKHAFWFRNMHDLRTARQFALGGCQEVARADGDDPGLCTLYASMIPKGMDPRRADASGVSEDALKILTGRYRKAQRPGRWGALAISGLFDWGYSAEKRSEAEAAGAARATCEAASDQAISGWSNDVRRRINQARLNTCRVVHITRP